MSRQYSFNTQSNFPSHYDNPKGPSEETRKAISYLVGHVNFLNRLAENPETQSLFLLNESNGETFLNETNVRLILRQAGDTQKYINSIAPNQEDSPFDFSKFPNFNLEQRQANIEKYLNGQAFDLEELKSLLMQEVFISSTLGKLAQKSQTPVVNVDENLTQESFNNLCQKLEISEEYTLPKYVEIVNNLTDKYLALQQDNQVQHQENQALNQQIKEFETQFQLIKQDNSDLHNERQTLLQQINNLNLNHSKINKENDENTRKINDENKLLKKQLQRYENTYSDPEWEKWARELHAVLVGRFASPSTSYDHRILIREAALTSLGGRNFQKRSTTYNYID